MGGDRETARRLKTKLQNDYEMNYFLKPGKDEKFGGARSQLPLENRRLPHGRQSLRPFEPMRNWPKRESRVRALWIAASCLLFYTASPVLGIRAD